MRIYLSIAVFLLTLSSCVSADSYPDNPDQPASPERDALFTQIALELLTNPWGEANMIAQHHFFCDTQNGQPDYNFKEKELNYVHLQYVAEWEEMMQHEREEQAALATALGKFFRARYFFTYSRFLGDIPMYEALQGETGNFTPRYDSQKVIMIQVLDWLKEANAVFNRPEIINAQLRIGGDPFFDGDPFAWQKVINAWSIRILIHLGKRYQDADLDYSARFQEIVNHPRVYPFISRREEDMLIRWPGNNFYKYPLYFSAVFPEIQQRRFPMASTFVDLMREKEDPRLPVIARPIDSMRLPEEALPDFNAYRGGHIGLLKEDLYEQVNTGKISYFNPKRYYTPEGEPTIIIGAAEIMFCLAEAANRGWITGNAEEYYEAGIGYSFNSYGLSLDDTLFATYRERIKYAGDNSEGLRQILEQKYVAFFQHSGYEAFFDQRRTGIPTFTTGPQNLNNQRIPKRWKYPLREYQTNREHVLEAVERQYQGVDDINAEMWMIR